MKKPSDGTELPEAFEVEFGPSWQGWVKRRTDAELRIKQLKESFGRLHLHVGLGVRRLTKRFFEFRISRGIRVVFAFIKPRIFRLAMTGNHDEVRTWLKENV
jgi:hypothetical protein